MYEVLNIVVLCEKVCFEEYNVEIFNVVIDMVEKMVEELFFFYNVVVDKNEFIFDGIKVFMIDDVKVVFDIYRELGFIVGYFDFEDGGM